MDKIYVVLGGTMNEEEGYHLFPTGSLVFDTGDNKHFTMMNNTSRSFKQQILLEDLKEIKNKS